MKLSELFAQGKFVVTSEVGPPKGTDTSEMLANAELLESRVDAINITDQQSSVMRLGAAFASTVDYCALFRVTRGGVAPGPQFTRASSPRPSPWGPRRLLL